MLLNCFTDSYLLILLFSFSLKLEHVIAAMHGPYSQLGQFRSDKFITRMVTNEIKRESGQ